MTQWDLRKHAHRLSLARPAGGVERLRKNGAGNIIEASISPSASLNLDLQPFVRCGEGQIAVQAKVDAATVGPSSFSLNWCHAVRHIVCGVISITRVTAHKHNLGLSALLSFVLHVLANHLSVGFGGSRRA